MNRLTSACSRMGERRMSTHPQARALTGLSKVPEVYPAVSSMFLADNGDLWAEIATTDDSPARYDVYRSNSF